MAPEIGFANGTPASKVLHFMDTQNNQIAIQLFFLVVLRLQDLINSSEKVAASLTQVSCLSDKYLFLPYGVEKRTYMSIFKIRNHKKYQIKFVFIFLRGKQ